MRHLAYFLSNHGKQLRYKVMPFLNLFLVVVSVVLNHHFNGGFCVFVVWAAIVQIVSFLNIILFTWLERTPLWRPNALMCGISTGVFLYWFCFTFPDNIILPIPQWFLFVLIWCNLVHPVNKKVRLWYAAGLVMCAVFVLWSGLIFRSAANGVRNGEYDKRNPMTERILGMHFRYHTRACPFDGWRPPLHDPAMVIGMRLNGDQDPLAPICLEDRVILYHTVFPDRPVMARCACSVESEGYGYFTDNLWKTLSFPPAPKIRYVNWLDFSPYYQEYNNQYLQEAGLPFTVLDDCCKMLAAHWEGRCDTIVVPDTAAYFKEVALVEFDGRRMYRFICEKEDCLVAMLMTPSGQRFITDTFNLQLEPYLFSKESLGNGQAVEIYYLDRDVRDTVRIRAVE